MKPHIIKVNTEKKKIKYIHVEKELLPKPKTTLKFFLKVHPVNHTLVNEVYRQS